MLLLGVDFFFFFFKSGSLLVYCQTVWIHIRPTILPGLIWTQTIYKISRRQKLSLARKELAKKAYLRKKVKIQIVAIYIVNVQTDIKVINLLLCILNSTEYEIYPTHNVKMQQLLAF